MRWLCQGCSFKSEDATRIFLVFTGDNQSALSCWKVPIIFWGPNSWQDARGNCFEVSIADVRSGLLRFGEGED